MGITHDTASFAVDAIRSWWRHMGRPGYPDADELLITADAGGSNGPRVRLWKWELQRFANRTGLAITVLHFPPGTSKWNKIEHRLFSYIAMNWRGKPLTSLAAVVSLIGSTTTEQGLRPRWIRPRGALSRTGGDVFPGVILDDTRHEFSILRSLRPAEVSSLRYLNAGDATTRYGTGYINGLILVTTGVRR